MDDELIRRAQVGDHLAFRDLVERYSTVVGRTARVLLRDPALAEEAAQDAWLDAWRHLPRFELGRPLRPWLLTLVTNRCRMTARRRSLPSVTLDSVAEQLIDPIAPAPAALGGMRDADLAAAVATLRPEHQRIIELRFFADLELAEIAQLTGTRLGTVKSRLHRALTALQRHLDANPDTMPRPSTKEQSLWQP